MAKKADQEKMPKDPKGDFLEAHKEVKHIYGGPDCYESKTKQKLSLGSHGGLARHPPEVPITFDHNDHPNFFPKPGQYPLIVRPIVKDVNLNRVLIDGGSSLNILFLKTFDQMGSSRSALRPSWAPFHGIVATLICQITLPMTFETQENFCTEHLQLKVADSDTS
jgi:hypothetical protein